MASGRSLAEVLAALERRIAAGELAGPAGSRSGGTEAPEAPRCDLPPGQACHSGWHLRRHPQGSGPETAYARCPLWRAERAAAAAREVPGAQTFESFDRLREPTAFTAARAWVEAWRAGFEGPEGLEPAGGRPRTLALLRPEPLAANTGCGKTHLLRAAARELARSGRWVALVSAPDLTAVVRGRALFDPVPRAEAEIQAKQWSRADVLLLDDLGQEETPAAATAGFLVGLLDAREGRALGWSSNRSEPELYDRYGAPLVSRLLAHAAAPALLGRDFRRFREWEGA